jgi:16S rRNA (guanine966-N2)-methyltransferase
MRESLFNICQNFIEGAHFLDIFAGSGAIGFEALSRSASFATFIDASKEAVQCMEKNAAWLQVKAHCRILYGDVFKLLERLEKKQDKFDIIFADPPYNTPVHTGSPVLISTQIVRFLDEHPLLTPGGKLFIEEDWKFQPKLTDLKHLELVDSIRMGDSALQRYELIPI